MLRIEKKDRKTDSEQVLTCEHTVSGNRREKEKGKRKGKKDRKTDNEHVLTCEHNVSGDLREN